MTSGGATPGSHPRSAVQPMAGDLTVAGLWRWLLDGDVADPRLHASLLAWAPDVCALTGVLLERAHAFRFVVSPPAGQAWPPPGDEPFGARVAAAAAAWRATMDGGEDESPPQEVRRLWSIVLDHVDTPVRALAEGRPWVVCEAVLALHAIADEASAGLTAGRSSGGPGSVFLAKGRELLARHGSVSRQPADRVTVVPKGRTTSVGITHRSLSRYVATAWDGIDVVWHAVPMPRPSVRAVARHANVLLLPWPLRIQASDFVPVPGTVRRPEREPFGFFRYEPSEPLDLHLVEGLLDAALVQVDGVDVVVLPEGCLDESQIAPFEAVLQRRGVPMLVCGLRPDPVAPGQFPANAVHTGLLLGDRWWHYRQDKHHRWFLDAGQIEAYDIAGALPPGIRWWEAMDIPKRSVHFLDLGGGVTVASVVCEDLARLDGVAELLRSVGPTLVVTLLLDGPQLATRWTARYASVLADDPGCAVLTLTALGMAVRSRPRGLPPSRVIAMWKDPFRGLREIACDPGSQGVLLQLELDARASRHAADGRVPVDDVADLRLAAVHQLAARSTAGAAPARPVRPPTAAPGLQPTELSVLSAWAQAVAEAMVAGGSVGEVLAQAARGAPWRAAAGTTEPSDRLQAALDVLGRAAAAGVAAVSEGPTGRPLLPAMRDAVDAAAVPGDEVGALACAVLASRLDGLALSTFPAPRRAAAQSNSSVAQGASETSPVAR
jgi:hypothetical protein